MYSLHGEAKPRRSAGFDSWTGEARAKLARSSSLFPAGARWPGRRGRGGSDEKKKFNGTKSLSLRIERGRGDRAAAGAVVGAAAGGDKELVEATDELRGLLLFQRGQPINGGVRL